MVERPDLTLSHAFMRAHPQQAAGVLDALPLEEAAMLFGRVPARLGAPVLAAMLPQRATQCLTAIDDDRVLELLTLMGTQPTVAVLRQLPEPRRRALLAGLPATVAIASAMVLGYDDDTLGAIADPDVVALPAATLAGDALQRLRESTGSTAAVLVVDAERRLLGVVELKALLRSGPSATVGSLMRPAGAVLSAVAPLEAAGRHEGWQSASALPVVERGDRLVGLMTRDALSRALRVRQRASADEAELELPVLFALGYWQALCGLIESALALLPRVRGVAGRADER